MRLVALPITRYTVPGPMPFSGIGLPYYDRTLETLFEAVNQAESAMSLPATPFWSYRLELNAGKYRLVQQDAVLAGDLVWSAEKQYGSDALDGTPSNHQHGTYSGPAPDTWLADPWTGAAGNGKTFAGNWIEQCRLALLTILDEQLLDPLTWLLDFKEMSRVEQISGANSGAWVSYGSGRYNLTTDHVEGMRLWPRSLVNMASGGEGWIVDGRLDDEAATADKAAPWCVPIDETLGDQIGTPIAILDSSSATASGLVITTDGYLMRWGGNVLRADVNPCGQWVDGCDYPAPLDVGGGAESGHFGVNAGGNVSIVGWISGNPSCLGTYNPIRPGMHLSFVSTTPDPDDPDYYALQRSDPVAAPLQNPKGIEVLDGSTFVVAEGGALVLMGWDGHDMSLCSRTTLDFTATGVTGERPGGVAPEGTGLGYRVLAGDADRRIRAVDLYPGAIAKFAAVVGAPIGEWLNLRPSHVYSEWGLCPIPDWGFYFRLLGSDIGPGEASGMSFHALRENGNNYWHDAWEIPGVALLAGSELKDDGGGGWYVEVARETRQQWTIPSTRVVTIDGSSETYILNYSSALHMWGEIWIQAGHYYPLAGGGLPNLDFLYRDGEAFDPGFPVGNSKIGAVAGSLGDRITDRGIGVLDVWKGTTLEERLYEVGDGYLSGIQIQPYEAWGELRPDGEEAFSILYGTGDDQYIAAGLWYQADPNWPGPPPNGPDYRLDISSAWAADWTGTNRQSSDTGWEAVTATTARWTDGPTSGTIHRAALANTAFFRAWLPFLWMFGIETDEDGSRPYTADWKLGVSGGKTYRQAFMVEAQYVNAFHRVYGRSVKTLQYRAATSAGGTMRWRQVQPAAPSDPASWLIAPEVGRWEGIPAGDTLYHEETISPTGANPWAEAIQPKQDEPMYILMESEADNEIILDSSFTPGVVGLRD